MILCDPTDCSLPGSSVHGISQARILEWVAISFSRGSSWPRDQTRGSCIGRRTLLPLSHQGRVKCSEVKEDCCYSVAQLCRTLCNPMDCSTPGLPVIHHLLELAQTHVQWVSDAFQSSCPLLFLTPRAFNLSQLRVFSNESACRIRWPKYWSFSFNISLSNEYSELISFRIDWFDLFAVQETLKSLLQCWAGWSTSWNQDCQEKYQ